MARFGSPYSAGFGSPDNAIAFWKATQVGPRIDVTVTPRSGYGDAWFGVYRDAKHITNAYIGEGDTVKIPVMRDQSQTRQSILVLRIGHLADPTYTNRAVARTFETDNSGRVSLDWKWTPSLVGAIGENGKTSSWSVSGLSFNKILSDPSHRTRGFFNLTITVSGGNATLTLDAGGTALASGTGAFPGTINLSAQNDSGLSASVAVASGATSVTGAKLYYRWPKNMLVKRDSGAGYSTVATVLFNMQDYATWTEASDLAAGSHNYKLQPTSDTDDLGTESGVLNHTVPEQPQPPTALAYDSGNYTNTVVDWVASVTAGVTYNVYVAGIGAQLNLNDPTATGVAGTSYNLAALTGYPGKARVLVRAVKSGAEEKNSNILDLEYDAAGDFVPARPNTPQVDKVSETVTSGLAFSIRGVYNKTDQAGVATKLQLFTRTVSGSYNFSVPEDEENLASSVFNPNFQTATLNKTFSSAGLYYITIKAATVAGVQSTDYADELLVYVSDVDVAAPTETAISVSRG